MKRKLFALFLACLMLVTAVPLSLVSAEGAADSTLTYSLLYNTPGRGGGYVTVSDVEDGVYWLYWGQDATTNLDKFIWITPVEVVDGKGTITLNQYLLIPEGATHLLLRTTDDVLVAALEIPAANLYDAAVLGEFEYSFVSVSDQHTNGKNNDGTYFANMHFMEQVLQLTNDFPNLKFIGDTGDLSDFPYLEALEIFSNSLDALYTKYGLDRDEVPFLANVGNHETWGNQIDGEKGDYAYAATFFEDPRFQMVHGDLLVDDGTGNKVISHRIYPIPGTNDYVFLFSAWACMWEDSFAVASKALIDLANTEGVGKIFCYQHLNVYGEAGDAVKLDGNASNETTANWGWDGSNRLARQNAWVEIIDDLQNVVVFNGHLHSNFNLNYVADYFVASAGNGDYSRQIYVPSRWAPVRATVSDLMSLKMPVGSANGLSLGTYQYVYEDALVSYGVNYNRYPNDVDEIIYQPVACLYIPYDEDSVVSNVEVNAGTTDLFVNPEDAVNGKDVSLTLTDTAGNPVNETVTYRVTDTAYNTMDAAKAYVADGKLYFTDAAEQGNYHVIAEVGNHTVVFDVEYRTVYINSFVTTDTIGGSAVPAPPYLWKSCDIDNDAHTIDIVMHAYTNPLVMGYHASNGYVSFRADETTAANRNYWHGREGVYANCYLYDGQQLTVTSADGSESAVYTVSITYPEVALEGSGTEADPYLISSTEDINYFYNKINETPWSNKVGAWSWPEAHIKLTNDVTCTVFAAGDSWTTHFDGIFDGDGHTITFAYAGDKATSSQYLFGKYMGGTVKNLKVDGNLSATGYVAFAYSFRDTAAVKNIHSDITANGTHTFILGSNFKTGAKFENILFTGTLNGTSMKAVFWGDKNLDPAVYSTFVDGMFYKGQDYVDATGIAATGELTWKLNNYAAENGLVAWGQDLSADATPVLGSDKAVYVGTNGYTNDNPESVAYLSELINVDTTNGASTSASAMFRWTSYSIDHAAKTVTIVMPAYNYPRVAAYTHSGGTTSLLTDVTESTKTNSNYWAALTNQYVNAYLYEGQKLTAVSADGKNTAEYTVHITYPTLSLEGSGTEADPFIIADSEDFEYIYKKFATLDWSANYSWSFPNIYFRQTADVTCTITPPDGNWWPICWWGNYDGGGHTITFAATTARTSGKSVLFSNLFRGKLENVTLAGTVENSTTSDTQASIAASLRNGSVIRNVHSKLTHTAYRAFVLSSGFETGAVVENFLFTGTLNGAAMCGVHWGGGVAGSKIYSTATNFTNGWTNYINATETAANGDLLNTLNSYAEANGLAVWKQTVGTDATPVLTQTVYVLAGDLNGDNELNSRDAIYLLYHTLLPEQYPIEDTAACDFNGDNAVDSKDATYLLYHIMMPEVYPIA